MFGYEYEMYVQFRNQTSVQIHKLDILFVTTDIETNFCNEIGYDSVSGYYKFTCFQYHVVFSILTLGKQLTINI